MNRLSIPEVLDRCPSDIFPNVSALLQAIITLPMTSCTVERVFSTENRIKNRPRASMGTIRLNNLSLLSFERELLDSWTMMKSPPSSNKPRRLRLVLWSWPGFTTRIRRHQRQAYYYCSIGIWVVNRLFCYGVWSSTCLILALNLHGFYSLWCVFTHCLQTGLRGPCVELFLVWGSQAGAWIFIAVLSLFLPPPFSLTLPPSHFQSLFHHTSLARLLRCRLVQ